MMARGIFQIVDRMYRLADRIRRILNTLDHITEPKFEPKHEPKISNMCSSTPFRKRIDNTAEKRLSGVFGSSKNMGNELPNQKSLPTSKWIPSKRSSQTHRALKILTPKHETLLSEYESILLRNPK